MGEGERPVGVDFERIGDGRELGVEPLIDLDRDKVPQEDADQQRRGDDSHGGRQGRDEEQPSTERGRDELHARSAVSR